MSEDLGYKPTVKVNAPCCICGSDSSREFFNCRFDKFRYSGIFYMRQCSGCGLLFCSPRLTDEGISALYDANYYVFHKKDADAFVRTAQIYQRTISRLPKGITKRAVEIGSGKGYLLAVLQELGWTSYGIELSQHAAQYAREKFGVQTYTGTLEQYLTSDAFKGQFPLILCIDIIEHVLDPKEFIRGLARLSSPEGYLIIDTPNGNAAHIENEGSSWRGFNPFHIFMFNIENLKRLLGSEGFEIVEIFSYNNFLKRQDSVEKYAAGMRSRVEKLIKPFNPFASPSIDSACSCAEVCRKIPDYCHTRDSRGDLAKELRGENLIVIARNAAEMAIDFSERHPCGKSGESNGRANRPLK